MKTPVITRLAYWRAGGVFALGALAAAPGIAMADEGGVSFWLPGLYGSLAATPEQPGWSFANIYYHATVSAGGDVAAARQFSIGAFTRTATVDLNANVNDCQLRVCVPGAWRAIGRRPGRRGGPQ